ncbi:MSEP-CTERM sorting domain-containing protein [Kiritimatiellaeota bacterium B1221]|nr:MSEP-CTERM sorting domain-containing protein [Kiritimatiellaeota bacterium B1221]
MRPLFKSRSEILPAVVRKPGFFLITSVMPVFLLIMLNAGFLWMLSSQLDKEMCWRWASMLVILILLMGAGLYLIRKSRRRNSLFPVRYSFLLLMGGVGYLALVTFWHEYLIPDAESLWILDSGRLLAIQFTFLMSAVFHNVLQIACIPFSFKRGNDLFITLLASVALPVMVYVFVVLLGDWSFFGGVFFLIIAGFTLISMMLILRAVTLLYLKCWGSLAGETFLILFLGLALPMGGLLLNRKIPFPADYQQSVVYVLTGLNALVLLLSLRGFRSRLPLVAWFLQWAFFPFTLYFFLVFLPWLPISLLAMIALGAGFLILAPTGLMLLHSLRIWHTRREMLKEVSPPVLIGVAILGFLILPGGFVGRALQDRSTLHEAISYVFEPDFAAPSGYAGRPEVLKRALKNLGKHYEGRYVPYLSDLYDALVFQGLVLPQSKMDLLHQTFFGEDAPEYKEGEWHFMSTSSRRNFRNPRGGPPSTRGVLEDVDWEVSHQDGVLTATAILTLHNPTATPTEFVQHISLPDGVWVTGYWLDVEGIRKPGRITERKTATWVYKTIRDATRRDPGLLVYDGPDALELRVFPLAADETRTTAITFSAIARPDLQLSIGEVRLPVPEDVVSPLSLKGGYSLSIPAAALDAYPPVERRPFLYLVVDRSVHGLENPEAAVYEALAPIVEKWGDQIAGCRVVSVNHTVTIDEVPWAWPLDLETVLPEGPQEGGLLLERAVVRMVQDHRQLMNTDTSGALTFPLPVWILGDGQIVRTDLPLAHWMREVPEWKAASENLAVPWGGGARTRTGLVAENWRAGSCEKHHAFAIGFMVGGAGGKGGDP